MEKTWFVVWVYVRCTLTHKIRGTLSAKNRSLHRLQDDNMAEKGHLAGGRLGLAKPCDAGFPQ